MSAFICRRPESKAGKMVNLPNKIHICSECMQKAFDSMNNGNIPYSDLMNMTNMSNISMINLSDLADQIPQKQKVKKEETKGGNP